MSKPRQALSGLKSVQRDWSSSQSPLPLSSDLDDIFTPTAQSSDMDAKQRRLKLIQDALAGDGPYSQPNPATNFQTMVKRPAPPSSEPAPTKKRQLPDGWKDVSRSHSRSHVLSSSSLSNSKAASSSAAPNLDLSIPSNEPRQKLKKVASVFLSQEQTKILKIVMDGENVFYTGSAGTGKSVLLREIIKSLRIKYKKSRDVVAITASTGIAACNIGGVTIHSFAGIGIGVEDVKHLETKVRRNKKAMSRWLRTKALIVDEISMVDGDMVDKLCTLACQLRKSTKPFGGIQLIITGDFFQLPPVSKGVSSVKFAFEADQWNQVIQRTFNLTKVFRQRDEEFVNMLTEMRFGRLTEKSIKKFKSLSREVEYDDDLAATELFPRREDVDRSNETRMEKLETKPIPFHAFDTGPKQELLKNCMAPKELQLQIGAQVMLIKNVDETLVNGSTGVIIRFEEPGMGTESSEKVNGKPASKKDKTTGNVILYPVVMFGNREVQVVPDVWKMEQPDGTLEAARAQVPLILAWAMSIHKSQGQTLERVRVDLRKIFEKGQAYVALSRATSLAGLQVLNFDPSKVKAHPKVVAWSETLESIVDDI